MINAWLLGIFDNKIRFVKLRKADGNTDVYSIKLLYPLEIHSNQKIPDKVYSSNEAVADHDSPETNVRSKRVAAVKAKRAIHDILKSE